MAVFEEGLKPVEEKQYTDPVEDFGIAAEDDIDVEVACDVVADQDDADATKAPTMWQRTKEFAGRHKGKIALGALAVSAALTFGNNDAHEVIDKALEAAPYAAAGVVASEVAFVVGAGMMAGAVSRADGASFKSGLYNLAETARDSTMFQSGIITSAAGLAIMNTYPQFAGIAIAGETALIGGAGMMVATYQHELAKVIELKDRLPELALRADGSRLFNAGFWVNTVGAVGTAASAGAAISHLPAESWGAMALPAADIALTVAVRKAMRAGINEQVTRANTDDASSFGPQAITAS